MRQLTECLACSCLIDARDAACPFCGTAAPRSSNAPPRLLLGFTLGLALADISCGPKSDDDGDTVTATTHATTTQGDTTILDPDSADASTYGGPDTTGPVTTTFGSTSTTDDSFPDASTYAGPGESSATEGEGMTEGTTTTSTSTSTSTSTGETTTDTFGSTSDASTYGGPDETGGTTG